MKLKTFILVSIIALLGFASSASAEGYFGGAGEGGGESAQGCFCEQTIGGTENPTPNGPWCTNFNVDACGAACTDNDDCAEGEACVDGAFSSCSDDCPGGFGDQCLAGICVISLGACVINNSCQPLAEECNEDNCEASSIYPNGAVKCPLVLPTLSQWGLILLGLALTTMMFLTIRNRGLRTNVAASLLLLGAVGLAAATASYAQIQSERVCGQSDIAVEFVNDLLNT